MKSQILQDLRTMYDIPKPAIGIDVDGTIDQAPEFFSVLSNSWPGDVHIITMRSDMATLVNDLKAWNIRYSKIHLVNTFSDKGKVIDALKLVMFFDDMPEVLQAVDCKYNVCLIRNDGNFNADTSKYIMSTNTAELI